MPAFGFSAVPSPKKKLKMLPEAAAVAAAVGAAAEPTSGSPEVVVAAAGLQSVYTAQADGSGVEEIGPLVGGVDDVTAQARLGGGSIAAHTESGAVWRYEARTRWTMVAEEITAIAFSG